MAKKGLMVLVLAAMVAGSVFAQEAEQPKKDGRSAFRLSVGAGGFIGGDFGGGVEVSAGGETLETKIPYFGGGGFAFLDATYAELTLGLFGGGGELEMSSGGAAGSVDTSYSSFNIGLLGKYPFAVNEKLSVFPLLGIEYVAFLSAELYEEDYDDPENLNALWIKFGGGLDYSFTEKIYLRFEALYGFRLGANKFEKDLEDAFKEEAKADDVDVDTKTLLGHGLTVKLGVGYKF